MDFVKKSFTHSCESKNKSQFTGECGAITFLLNRAQLTLSLKQLRMVISTIFILCVKKGKQYTPPSQLLPTERICNIIILELRQTNLLNLNFEIWKKLIFICCKNMENNKMI